MTFYFLGGGNSNILKIFTPKFGEMIQFVHYFSNGLKPPTRVLLVTFFSFFSRIIQRRRLKKFSMKLEPFEVLKKVEES